MSAVNVLLFGAGAAVAGLVILAVRKIRQDRQRGAFYRKQAGGAG